MPAWQWIRHYGTLCGRHCARFKVSNPSRTRADDSEAKTGTEFEPLVRTARTYSTSRRRPRCNIIDLPAPAYDLVEPRIREDSSFSSGLYTQQRRFGRGYMFYNATTARSGFLQPTLQRVFRGNAWSSYLTELVRLHIGGCAALYSNFLVDRNVRCDRSAESSQRLKIPLGFSTVHRLPGHMSEASAPAS